MDEPTISGVTTAPDVDVPARHFVSDTFEARQLASLEAYGDELRARSLASAADLERWILDWSELTALVGAGRIRLWIALSRNTADEEIRAAYTAYSNDVIPPWQRIRAALAQRYLECPYRHELPSRFAMFDRAMVRESELFRESNVEVRAKDRTLRARHSQILGARTVAINGDVVTVQQARVRLSEPLRATRRGAFMAIHDATARDENVMNALLDEMLATRSTLAANADLPNYRAYAFVERGRDDYTPDDCLQFHDAVEAVVVPALRERHERRRQQLGVDRLRPWDMHVDPHREHPHRPFRDQDGYVALGRKLFAAVDPRFASEFDVLVRNQLLDLMSRPGKAPGGYNAEVFDIRLPFIFSNAVGDAREVRTLLHEGGHAFHTLATRDEPIAELAHAPIEFAEVASMSMELIAMENYGAAYEAEDARRNGIALLESRLEALAWIAAIDAFQHWLYLHPQHSHDERADAWLAVHRRFTVGVDWEGLESVQARLWQNQQHIFRVPFYYIEYAIAAMGALQVWKSYRAAPREAIEKYRAALALGGTRPLPELFDRAGARFGLDERLLREVVTDLMGVITERDR